MGKRVRCGGCGGSKCADTVRTEGGGSRLCEKSVSLYIVHIVPDVTSEQTAVRIYLQVIILVGN